MIDFEKLNTDLKIESIAIDIDYLKGLTRLLFFMLLPILFFVPIILFVILRVGMPVEEIARQVQDLNTGH